MSDGSRLSAIDRRRLAATVCRLARDDLSVFVQGAFRVLNDDPLLRNWHMEAIAYQLMRLACGDLRRLLITMPPRTLKSFIASVCLPAWLLGIDPGEKIICASYAQDLSEEFAFQMRRLMQSEWYRRIFPATRLDPRKTSLREIGTTRGGYRLSTSVGGTLTGRGGNFVIIDDPLKAKDAYSEVARENGMTWFRSTVLSRLNSPRRGRILVVAQRLHMEDMPGQLLTQGIWSELCLPLIADRDQPIHLAADLVAERPAGGILHEARFGDEEIALLRETMGERDFEAQYNQRPLPPGGALFKLEWLRRYDEPPKVHQIEGIFQSWDTAYDIEETNDYSVCTTWALSGLRCWLLDVHRARLEFWALERAVYELRAKWNADLVIVEKAGSGISLFQNIRREGRNAWLHIKAPVGSKQDRASQQSPKFERGQIWVPRQAPWLRTFEDEFASFPHGKHDDQVDSVVQFLAALDTGMLLELADQARRLCGESGAADRLIHAKAIV